MRFHLGEIWATTLRSPAIESERRVASQPPLMIEAERVLMSIQDHCRNNVGNWPTRQVDAPRGARGFEYYSLKDRAMAEAAEYGLMLWDGKSKGTVNNVVNLSRDHKPVVVYVAPTKQFRTVKTFDDLKDLLARGDSDSVERIVSELHLNVAQRAVG